MKKFFLETAPPKLFKGLDDRALPYLKVWIQHWLESSNTVRSLLKEIWRGKIPFLHFIANSIPGGAKICSDAEERKGDLEFQESEIIWCSGGLYGSLLPSPPSLVFFRHPPSHNPVRAFNRLLHVQLRSVWKEEELLIFCPQWSLIVRRGSKTNRIRW